MRKEYVYLFDLRHLNVERFLFTENYLINSDGILCSINYLFLRNNEFLILFSNEETFDRAYLMQSQFHSSIGNFFIDISKFKLKL